MILAVLWIFLIIPILLMIISLITIGEAWRMLRIYLVEITPRKNTDFRSIISHIQGNGGAVSENWKEYAYDAYLIDQGEQIRENYLWFMRGVSIIAYSLFLLTFLAMISYTVDYLFTMDTATFRLVILAIFGSITLGGFIISIMSVYKQYHIKSYFKNRG